MIVLIDDMLDSDKSNVLYDELTPDSNFTVTRLMNVRKHLIGFKKLVNGYA